MIFRMVAENPTWGAPRIHGELLCPSPKIPTALEIKQIAGLALARFCYQNVLCSASF